MRHTCPTPADTLALASRLAPSIRAGDVIVLAGRLGAGKTLFAGGLAAGLGIEEPVISPTFVLMRQYRSGFLPMIHVDVYRLGTLNEFDDLDVFDLAAEGVLVIEWGDAVDTALPADHLRVEIGVGDDEGRVIELVPYGSWVGRRLEVAP